MLLVLPLPLLLSLLWYWFAKGLATVASVAVVLVVMTRPTMSYVAGSERVYLGDKIKRGCEVISTLLSDGLVSRR